MAESVASLPKSGIYRSLDAWRGFAALSVVLFHWGEMVVHGNPGLVANPIYETCSYGYLGVQLFFVISGYVIANSAESTIRRGEGALSFLKARARRIFPTYWAGLILTLAFYYLGYWLARLGVVKANIYTQSDPLTASWLFYLENASLTMGWLHQYDILAVAWTLSYEIAFYVVFGIVLWTLSAVGQVKHLLTALHAITILSLVWLIVRPYSCPIPLNMWPQFGFGILVYDLAAHPASRLPRVLGALTLLLLVIFVSRYDILWVMNTSTRLTFLVAAGFALALGALYRFDQRVSNNNLVKIMALCGTFSYSLYLTQVVSLRILNQAAMVLHFPRSLHLLLFPIAILFAIVSAYGFFLLFERPLLKRGKNRMQFVDHPSGTARSGAVTEQSPSANGSRL